MVRARASDGLVEVKVDTQSKAQHNHARFEHSIDAGGNTVNANEQNVCIATNFIVPDCFLLPCYEVQS